MRKIIYYKVWSLPLRLFHWALVISIVLLAITGFFINNPWPDPILAPASSMPMATMRYLHLITGYVFTAAILIRIYLLFGGNRYEQGRDFLPVSRDNINNLLTTLSFYLYCSKKWGSKRRDRHGHNVLAGSAYLITIIIAIIQIISGFYLLYPESIFWQNTGISLFGSQQSARFLHHVLMWYFIIFPLFHIYIIIWNELKLPHGMLASIFTGKKHN